MKSSSALWLAWLLPGPVIGFVGMGEDMYKPACAYACQGAVAEYMLSCSSHESMSGGHSHDDAAMTTPECRAGNTAYLTTLAWCMDTKCAQYKVPASKLEKFWEEQSTGEPSVVPKWTFAMAFANISQSPMIEVSTDDTLNITSLPPEDGYDLQYSTLTTFENEEVVHARYGVVILVTGFATPIVLTWLGYLPYMTSILEKVKPYLVYPSAIGTYQVRPLPFLLGNAPTIGQTFYIALMLILNLVLTSANYKAAQPFAWYETQAQQVVGFVMFRTGTIAFALFPLVMLFSGRNNILLWLSNWSHSTFVLLHRWIARLFAIQALLHSILALALYVDTDAFSMEQEEAYWIWGAVATVAVSVMLVASGLWVRRWSYELFLITHIVLAVIVVVGCWYHVYLRFGLRFGYTQWMYAVCAVWAFDRLARVGRVLKTGVRHARVVEVGEGFVRVDIEGIRWGADPGKIVYAYFPTLNPLRPWENHPFSVLPTSMLRSSKHSVKDIDLIPESAHSDIEKHVPSIVQTATGLHNNNQTTAGITLFIRKSTGITKFLKANHRLLTLLDGPYANNSTKSVLRCDRLLLIGGGIGITGLLPWLNRHPNVKLYWSVKDSARCLVEAMQAEVLHCVLEKDVRIGHRHDDIPALLTQEAHAGWAKIGVVACGPAGLDDDVRAAVVAIGRKEIGKTVFELDVDAYSW